MFRRYVALVALLPFLLFAVACDDSPERDEEGTVIASGQESVFSLRVGDCFDRWAENESIRSVAALPCTDAHDLEIYHAFDLDDGDFPGTDAVVEAAADGCIAEFEPFVGKSYQESDLDIATLYPTADSWDDGDREVLCSIYAMDGSKLTGTAKGANR